MISVDIEKEVQQENKLFMGLSTRKCICVLAALVFAVLFALIFQWDFSISVFPSLVVGALAFAFGWIKKDGLTFEQFAFKYLKTYLYKNDKRKYRTKNKYIQMFNKEYRRHEQIDMQDKKTAKAYKRAMKKDAKRVVKSSLKPIN